jgi:DNA-binding transcriptional regulator GbsR (MarR family)
MHFWGFKRPMGRIWTILYLSPEPVSAADLGTNLKMSAGAVSMALAELEKWGAVTRTWIPGARRDYFVAEASIWKMVQRVVKERELSLVKEFGATLASAEKALTATDGGVEEDLPETLSYKRERLRRLSALTRAGETILTALVAGDAVDPTVLTRGPEEPD